MKTLRQFQEAMDGPQERARRRAQMDKAAKRQAASDRAINKTRKNPASQTKGMPGVRVPQPKSNRPPAVQPENRKETIKGGPLATIPKKPEPAAPKAKPNPADALRAKRQAKKAKVKRERKQFRDFKRQRQGPLGQVKQMAGGDMFVRDKPGDSKKLRNAKADMRNKARGDFTRKKLSQLGSAARRTVNQGKAGRVGSDVSGGGSSAAINRGSRS